MDASLKKLTLEDVFLTSSYFTFRLDGDAKETGFRLHVTGLNLVQYTRSQVLDSLNLKGQKRVDITFEPTSGKN